MSRKLIVKLLAGIAIFIATSLNAATERALVCQDCSYQQAKSLALSNAQPSPECQTAPGSGYPTLENQICYSQPKNIIIFDAVSRQPFAFEVYHTNQGGTLADLRRSVSANDRRVNSTAISLLNTGVDMHTELMNSFNQIAQRLITHQQLNTAQVKNNMSYVMAQSSCEQDADAQAIFDAFDSESIGALQRYAQIVQQEQTNGILDSFMSFFDRNTASLDSAGFQLTKQGLLVSGKVVISPKTTSFSAVYNSATDISYVEGRGVNAMGTPTLVYDIKANQSGDLLVQVNKNNSYLSSNVPLASVTSATGNNVQVSSCAADAIASVLPNIQFGTTNGGGIGNNNPPPGSGTLPGSSCKKTLYGSVNGTVVLVLTINIC